jgi:glycosyltransferase involved in cell wall biosynthesis
MSDKKRILYVANVQGPEIVKKRGIVRNYSIAGNTKVFGICKALLVRGHSVIIYSPASVAERTGQFHLSGQEHLAASDGFIPVVYGSTIDNRYLRNLVEWCSALRWIPVVFWRHTINTVIVYNVSFLTLGVAVFARLLGKQVFMEYEDSAVAARTSSPPWWKKVYRVHERIFRRVLAGAFAPSLGLLNDLGVANRLCLPGALDNDLVEVSSQAVRSVYSSDRPLRLVYAGGLDLSKGIDRFLQAVELIDSPLEINICGHGPLAETISELCRNSRHKATFHGLVSREKMLEQMVQSDVGINAHRSDLHEGGSWPFKVVEYLATCGTVFCNSSGAMPLDMRNKLFMYHADDVEEIAEAFASLVKSWPDLATSASLRRIWAIKQFGPDGLVDQLEALMACECVHGQTP